VHRLGLCTETCDAPANRSGGVAAEYGERADALPLPIQHSSHASYIAYHIFCLNGVIMKLASAEHENYVSRVVSDIYHR
jgi:hypothetical protein